MTVHARDGMAVRELRIGRQGITETSANVLTWTRVSGHWVVMYQG